MPNESIHWNHPYSSCLYPYSVMGYRSIARPLLSLSPRLINYRTGKGPQSGSIPLPVPHQTSNIMETQLMDSYTACSIVEGFCGHQPTQHDMISAWSYLISSGDCWRLQGFYGRTANALIENGYFDTTGEPSLDCLDAFYDYGNMGAAAGRDLLDED